MRTEPAIEDINVGTNTSTLAAHHAQENISDRTTAGVLSHIFFKVAERPLTSSTFLGQTSMSGVDFFGNAFSVLGSEVDDAHSQCVVVAPQDHILVATSHRSV